MVLGKKAMFLFNISDPDNPMELAFQNKYGHIVDYKWSICSQLLFLENFFK